MNNNFTYERVGDKVYAAGDNWLYEKVGDLTRFTQTGKVPSIRTVKALIKEMNKLTGEK